MIERIRNAPYRIKNYFLIGGVLLVGYLSWTRAISATLTLYERIEGTQEKIEKAEGAEARIAELKGDLARMERTIGSGGGNGMAPQQRLLEKVGAHCDLHGLRIHSIPEPHRYQREQLLVRSFFIEVQGDLKGFLKLLHALETEEEGGQVSNVTFYSKKDLRTQRKYLYAKILVQYVERA